MRIRNKKSTVSEAPEGESPTPARSRITVWLYFLVLGSIVVGVLWYTIYWFLHYDGSGQIHVERTVISTQRDGRIEKLWPKDGDTVGAGDPLARVDPGTACTPPEGSSLREQRRQVRENRLRLRNLEQRLSRKRQELERFQKGTALELEQNPQRRAQLQEEIVRLRDEIEMLRLRVQLGRRAADSLAAQPTVDPQCQPFVVSAPHAGRVYQVFQSAFAVVDAGTPILSLVSDSSSAVVLSYLDTEMLGNVRAGDTVTVTLPNDTKSRGVIERLYSSAQEFAEIKRDGYRPLPSQLLVRIVPVRPSEGRRWSRFDRMSVDIEGPLTPSSPLLQWL